MSLRTAALAGCLVACLIGTAQAQQVYDYTGRPLSGTISTPNGCNLCPPTTTPVTLTLSGTITLPTELAPNLSNSPVTPTYALFGFAGQAAVGGPLQPGPVYYPGCSGCGAPTVLFGSFDFSTNSTGQITGWDVQLMSYINGYAFAPLDITSTPAGDTAVCNCGSPDSPEYLYASNSTAGSWVAVPEIDASGAFGALTLLAFGLAVLGGRGRIRV